jgi:hypothetical protein
MVQASTEALLSNTFLSVKQSLTTPQRFLESDPFSLAQT